MVRQIGPSERHRAASVSVQQPSHQSIVSISDFNEVAVMNWKQINNPPTRMGMEKPIAKTRPAIARKSEPRIAPEPQKP